MGLFLLGCTSIPITDTSNPAPLADPVAKDTPLDEAYWKLVELYGAPLVPMAGSSEVHIIFHGADKSVTGSGSCNRFSGNYELFTDCTGTWLNILQLGATRMACPDMNTEMFFFQALGETKTFDTGPDTMMLMNGSGEVIARFEAVWLQ